MASDVHLRLDGIDGDSRDESHQGEIEVTSHSHGMTMAVTQFGSSSASGTMEKANFLDLTITKSVDSSSPKLQRALIQGTVIPAAQLSFDRADGTGKKVIYLQYVLNNVIITAYSIASTGSGLPMESVSFAYERYYFVYVDTDPSTGAAKGSIETNWDLALNKQP
jgi:type VI secretion system secreted protein Hcp